MQNCFQTYVLKGAHPYNFSKEIICDELPDNVQRCSDPYVCVKSSIPDNIKFRYSAQNRNYELL